MRKRKITRYSYTASFFLICLWVLYFNSSKTGKGPSCSQQVTTQKSNLPFLNSYFTKLNKVPWYLREKIKSKIETKDGVINYELYKLNRLPLGWRPSDNLKHMHAELLGVDFDLFRQQAYEPREDSYYYFGNVLKTGSRIIYGDISVTYQRGYAKGVVRVGGKYMSIITLEEDLFALVERKEPTFICGNDNSKETVKKSQQDLRDIIFNENINSNLPGHLLPVSHENRDSLKQNDVQSILDKKKRKREQNRKRIRRGVIHKGPRDERNRRYRKRRK